jgi:hypothetical protein
MVSEAPMHEATKQFREEWPAVFAGTTLTERSGGAIVWRTVQNRQQARDPRSLLFENRHEEGAGLPRPVPRLVGDDAAAHNNPICGSEWEIRARV